jgi:hypothetical protein
MYLHVSILKSEYLNVETATQNLKLEHNTEIEGSKLT